MVKTRSPTEKPFVQYSKRLATGIALFWAGYRLLALLAAYLRPTLADGLRAVGQGVDDVMMCNVAFYCGNSVAEKGLLGYFGRKPAAEETSTDGENVSNG